MIHADDSVTEQSADAEGESLVIKHPYVGMVEGHYSVFFMEDKGQDLAEILEVLRTEWKKDFKLRKAFYFDVGQSMWNLVSRLYLINNDLRLPNVTRSGNSFCVIDFDMCKKEVDYSFKRSNIFKDLDFKVHDTMHLASLIQITFIVFFLDAEECSVEGQKASQTENSIRDIFLKGKDGSEKNKPRKLFDKWLETKGEQIRCLFAPSSDRRIDKSKYFSVLRSLLSLREDQL